MQISPDNFEDWPYSMKEVSQFESKHVLRPQYQSKLSKRLYVTYSIQLWFDTSGSGQYCLQANVLLKEVARHLSIQMVSWAFEPAEEEVLVNFISKGRADAEAWALQSGAAGALKEVDKAAQGLAEEDYPALKSWKAIDLQVILPQTYGCRSKSLEFSSYLLLNHLTCKVDSDYCSAQSDCAAELSKILAQKRAIMNVLERWWNPFL